MKHSISYGPSIIYEVLKQSFVIFKQKDTLISHVKQIKYEMKYWLEYINILTPLDLTKPYQKKSLRKMKNLFWINFISIQQNQRICLKWQPIFIRWLFQNIELFCYIRNGQLSFYFHDRNVLNSCFCRLLSAAAQ